MGFYCGIGFLKQLALARKTYIWLAVYGIINSLLSTPVLIRTMVYMGFTPQVKTQMVIGMVLGIAVTGWILYYVVRRKDYFTN